MAETSFLSPTKSDFKLVRPIHSTLPPSQVWTNPNRLNVPAFPRPRDSDLQETGCSAKRFLREGGYRDVTTNPAVTASASEASSHPQTRT